MPKRKSNRLKCYDYSQNGSYFITICVRDKDEILWNCRGDYKSPDSASETVRLSDYGTIVGLAIENIPKHYPQVAIDKYVIMPNHVHMILSIVGDMDGRLITAPTLSRVIQQFKGYASKQVGFTLWQKSFHDHVIRNESEYREICQYIDENPLKWQEDCYYRGY